MNNKNPATYPSPVTIEATSTNDPMEFLSRGWTLPVLEMSRPLGGFAYASQIKDGSLGGVSLSPSPGKEIGDVVEFYDSSSSIAANTFPFASSVTSQLVMDRIMSQSEVSPLTSGRPSHSSGPLNGGGSLTESPPPSPSTFDEAKHCVAVPNPAKPSPHYRGGSKTVGRWLKDRKEKKKEEARAHTAQLHAASSVAGVAAAVAAIAAATAAASKPGKEDRVAKTDMAVASAATLVAAQLVEAAESMGVEREHLASVVHSAVNVRTPSDIVTLTAAAATALRGAATLKARALKDAWNIAAVIPVDKSGIGGHHRHVSNVDEVVSDDASTIISLADQELLARGTDLLKRTRKGDLHRKIVSIDVNKSMQVVLKMKSRHVVGAITKKKKYVVVEVCKEIQAWSNRNHLVDGMEQRRYFGLKTTADQRVIEFECRSPKEFMIWTNGVSCLLNMVADKRAGRRI